MSDRKIVRVEAAMRTQFDRMEGMTTVAEALRTLRHPQAKAIIIEKRHADDEFGIVMLSDIGRKVLARDRSPDRMNLYELMSKPYVTVGPEMDVRYCARLFEQFRLARTPVIKDRNVIGIVSFTDLVVHGFAPYLGGPVGNVPD